MARYKDPIVTEVLGKQLMPGEQLQNWAYGVKQPNIGLIILLMCMAILPGAIAVAILTKEYVIGLTSHRLIILQVKGGKATYVIGLTSHRLIILQVKGGKATIVGKQEYNRGMPLPPVKTSTGGIFTHIKIADPQRPFVAKFHRMGMPNNRQHAMAIAAAISPAQLPQAHA